MESTDKNDYHLGPIRGSRLPVKVQKSFTAAEVLSAEILKHSNHDQFFCSSEDYEGAKQMKCFEQKVTKMLLQ